MNRDSSLRIAQQRIQIVLKAWKSHKNCLINPHGLYHTIGYQCPQGQTHRQTGIYTHTDT